MSAVTIAHTWPASEADVETLSRAPLDTDDGRSAPRWIRFANGDLALITWPQGETYEVLVNGPESAGFHEAEREGAETFNVDSSDLVTYS